MITAPFPQMRLRRMRNKTFTRRLIEEHHLASSDLIYPLFFHPNDSDIDIPAMPGQQRLGETGLLKTCEICCELQIPAIMLFPVIPSQQKSLDAKEAYNPEGLVPKTIQQVKKRFPELGIITDIALDPYTSHGQDGLIDANQQVLNDETVTVLCRQAIVHAQAGADMVAPSDMMDGRIGAIRRVLDERGCNSTGILSYAAKFASAFYGPFREAVGSQAALGKADKKSYQITPSNQREAMREIALDIQEGSDMLMIKPGGPYLDVIARAHDQFNIPIVAYQVSGEYAMIKAAAEKGWLDAKDCMLESLIGFKRAGCNSIATYFALEAARLLK